MVERKREMGMIGQLGDFFFISEGNNFILTLHSLETNIDRGGKCNFLNIRGETILKANHKEGGYCNLSLKKILSINWTPILIQ